MQGRIDEARAEIASRLEMLASSSALQSYERGAIQDALSNQVLALFDRSHLPGYKGPDAGTSTIDHIAFEIPLAAFTSEVKRLQELGLEIETAEHAWVNWRSLYVKDPEGNQVELVAYDPSV